MDFVKWKPGQCAIVIDKDIEMMVFDRGKSVVEEMAKEAVINVDLAILRMMIIKKSEREK